ncbi:MAG: primosomal protein N', partial [Candidatus Latescibacterota bacterium]
MPGLSNTTSRPKNAFAKIALPVPVDSLFTYSVPEHLQPQLFVGCRVEVPFGRRVLRGVVVELTGKTDIERTRPVAKILGAYLSSELMELVKWMASYYGCTLGEAAQAALPTSLRRAGAARRKRLLGTLELSLGDGDITGAEQRLKRAPRQLELLRRVANSGGRIDATEAVSRWGFNTTHIKGLIDKGLMQIDDSPPTSSLDTIDAPVVRLNPDQKRALSSIENAIAEGEFRPVLLHGVTGSGKTELYLRAAKKVLESGGGCIILVPEIGLIPQAVARYKRVFRDEIAIIHSRLGSSERFDVWSRIEKGECRIVLGPRSAIFSPVCNLRLIVVDEEQDDSYKQDDKPRYHARNVALMRGKFEKLTVVLGSATPSLESLHHATAQKYSHLTLPKRVGGGVLPRVHLIDLREQSVEGAFCSAFLLERLGENINKGHQSILFLNKRGHARFIQCNACGWVARCKNCDIALIYHRPANRLRCHYCGYNRAQVTRCDECSNPKLYFAGAGTQRVELDLAALFPGVGILRMDADTTGGKEGHRNVLEKFGTGDYPVLIGTQMVAKGHHFPRVNLVGVLHAEESLNYPDFRSSERTFRQLIQVAGRAGRGSDPGKVIVQTYNPDHYAVRLALDHDYESFVEEELKNRKELDYPPYKRLVVLRISGPGPASTRKAAVAAGEAARKFGGVRVIGPAPAPWSKIKDMYRWQLLIKSASPKAAREAAR